MNSYNLYIFDLDDTLFPTYKNVIKCHYPKLADKLGVEYPGDDVVSQYWGKDLIESLEGIFKVVPDNVIDILLELHSEYRIEPFPKVKKILSTLKKHKKYVGIFSASFPDIMNYYINNYFVPNEKWFDFLLNTNAQHISKPSPHIVYLMMEKYRQLFKREIMLSEVVVIGDSLADYYTSKNAQVDFAAVLTGPTGRDEFIQAGLDQGYIYDSVQEALTPPDKHGIVAIIRNRKGEFLMVKETRPDSPYLNHWSGPHGRCIPEDIIEEETVMRETQEETGMLVRPLKKLYTRPADTKISTVSFWKAELVDNQIVDMNFKSIEGTISWKSINEIQDGSLLLYPGTKDFFSKYLENHGGTPYEL